MFSRHWHPFGLVFRSLPCYRDPAKPQRFMAPVNPSSRTCLTILLCFASIPALAPAQTATPATNDIATAAQKSVFPCTPPRQDGDQLREFVQLICGGPTYSHCQPPAPAYIVMKDSTPNKNAAWILMPAANVTGVEDPAVFNPPIADLWNDAWTEWKQHLSSFIPNPAIGVNSQCQRSQDLLHLHLSCVSKFVRQSLAAHDATIGSTPSHPAAIRLGPSPDEQKNNVYLVVKVPNLIGDNSPFKIAAQFPGAAADLRGRGIAVIPAPDGEFYVASTTYLGYGSTGNTESLLDQNCTGQ